VLQERVEQAIRKRPEAFHSTETIQWLGRGLYFGTRTIFIPPPLEKDIFPLSHMSFSTPIVGLYIYFTVILPLFSFSLPFLPFYFPFLPFYFTYSPFFSSPFHIFPPQMTSADIPSPPREGGGYYPIYRLLGLGLENIASLRRGKKKDKEKNS
jgi:hypothetical protein